MKDNIFQYEPLWNSWYVEKAVGEGNYGVVYKVNRDEWGLKQEAAVKYIPIRLDEEEQQTLFSENNTHDSIRQYLEDSIKNIVEEIRILYVLKGNDNIVSFEDCFIKKIYGKLEWDVFIRMEYLNPLSNYISDERMSQREILELGIDMCKALEICKRENIIHRDIKETNIFVRGNDVYKLGDFGISKQLSTNEKTFSYKGTPYYMAPEALKMEDYDERVDIYSLGIVLYRLFNYGRMPFIPKYPKMITLTDREEAFTSRLKGKDIPKPSLGTDDISRIIIKACSHDKDKRYASATIMKSDLERALANMDEDEKSKIITVPIMDTCSKESREFERDLNKRYRKQEINNISNPGSTNPGKNILEKLTDTIVKKVIIAVTTVTLIFTGIGVVNSMSDDGKNDNGTGKVENTTVINNEENQIVIGETTPTLTPEITAEELITPEDTDEIEGIIGNVSIVTDGSNIVYSTPEILALDKVTSLTAVKSDGSVKLSWETIKNASSYKVYMSQTSSSGYSLVESGITGTTYTVDNLTNGETYYFVVRASNSNGDSSLSNQVSAVPQVEKPDEITTLVAHAGINRAELTWTRPARATKYYIYISTSTSGTYTLNSTISSTKASLETIITGLNAGTIYYFKVIASNAGGDSGYSNLASALILMEEPAAVTDLKALYSYPISGVTVLTLYWSAPSRAQSYYIYRKASTDEGWTLVKEVTSTSYTASGLTKGVTYGFMVRAVNDGGIGPDSNIVTGGV